MTSLTFVTPCASEHEPYLAQCIASVQVQTVPCEHYYLIDSDGRGPGYLRNRMLEKVTTEYVSFLDADDWVEPDYAEKMLAACRPGYYVYPDWWQDADIIEAPHAHAWCAGTWHVVTAVIETRLAKWVGGFDEELTAMEDTSFFLKLVTRNVCGLRVPFPLMHYRANGGRAASAHRDGRADIIKKELTQRYGGIHMACCGDQETINNYPVGVKQQGDILAQALWGGNRVELGRATGRHYPRVSYPATAWVDPRDVAAAPSLWRMVVEETSELAPMGDAVEGVDGIVDGMVARGIATRPPEYPQPVEVEPTPDFARVKKYAKRGRPKKNAD